MLYNLSTVKTQSLSKDIQQEVGEEEQKIGHKDSPFWPGLPVVRSSNKCHPILPSIKVPFLPSLLLISVFSQNIIFKNITFQILS